MGYELDVQQAEQQLTDGLTRAFSQLFAQLPSGTVREVDSVGPDGATIYIEDAEGLGETWRFDFAAGKPLAIYRVG